MLRSTTLTMTTRPDWLPPGVFSAASRVLDRLTGGAISHFLAPVERALRDEKAKGDLQSALVQALSCLRASGFLTEGAGAVDEAFITDDIVIEHLWATLFDPSDSSPIDISLLSRRLEAIWSRAGTLPREIAGRQAEAVEELVDVLTDQCAEAFPHLREALARKTIRSLDSAVPPGKHRRCIEQYLDIAQSQVSAAHETDLAGAPYVEPAIVRRAVDRAEPEPPAGLRPVPADLLTPTNEYGVDDLVLRGLLTGRPPRRIGVVSDTGLGKSTLLREIFLRATAAWATCSRVPIFFPPDEAAYYAGHGLHESLVSLLRSGCTSGGLKVRDPQLDTIASGLMRDGALLLLIDALDQITDPQHIVGLLNSLEGRRDSVVVTYRPSEWLGHCQKLRGFEVVELRAFDTRLRAAYFSDLPTTPWTEELPTELTGIPIIGSLMRVARETDHESKARPKNRAETYRYILRSLLERHQDRRILNPAPPRSALQLLQTLALGTLCRRHFGSFPRSVGEEILGAMQLSRLASLQHVLHLIELTDRCVFRHRSIQEYLAAEHLLEVMGRRGVKGIRSFLFHPDWEEPVQFLAGLLDDSHQLEGLVGELLPQQPTASRVVWSSHLGLAARCLHESKVPAPQAEAAVIDALGNLMQANSRRAIAYLEEWGHGMAVQTLLDGLADSATHDAVRGRAAYALGKIGSDKAAAHLINVMADSDAPGQVRLRPAYALGKIGSDTAVAALMDALADSDADVRWQAADALEKIGSDKAVATLTTALADSDAPGNVRSAAANCVGPIGSDTAVATLTTALADSGAPDNVRSAAADALGSIGSDKAVAALTTALADSDAAVRSAAADALGKIGSDTPVAPLITALTDSNAPGEVRLRAADALGKIGSDTAVAALTTALADSDAPGNVRSAAADALARIDSDKAVALLIEVFDDSATPVGVRWAAADALARIGSDKAVATLTTALADSDAPNDIRERIANALGGIGSDEAIQPLISILAERTTHHYVRCQAAFALERIGSDEAVQPLIDVLADSATPDDLRTAAADVLSGVASSEAVTPLITALADSSMPDYVRWAAADALGRIGSDDAVQPLIDVVADSATPDDLRSRAALALSRLPATEVLELAEKRLTSPRGAKMGGMMLMLLEVMRQASAKLQRMSPPSQCPHRNRSESY